MGGRSFVFDTGDPSGRARAHAAAAAFRAESVGGLRLAPQLRRYTPAEIVALVDRGRARVEDGWVMPAAAGGAQSRYSAFPNASNAAVLVAATTAAKTLLQVATPSTQDITLISWEISFDGSAAGKPLTVEVFQSDVAATVTALTPGTYSDPNAPASLCVGGTSATGYNASVEGSIAATRFFDVVLVPPTSGLLVQFPLGREPGIPISKFLRMRVTGSSGVTPNAAPGFVWEE